MSLFSNGIGGKPILMSFSQAPYHCLDVGSTNLSYQNWKLTAVYAGNNYRNQRADPKARI